MIRGPEDEDDVEDEDGIAGDEDEDDTVYDDDDDTGLLGEDLGDDGIETGAS